MTEFTGIAYEPHPVTPERKAELRALGLRIIDIQFKPQTPHNDADSPAIDPSAMDMSADATVEPAAEPAAPAAPVVTKSSRKSKP